MKRFLKVHSPLIGWAILIMIVSSIPYINTPDLGFSLQDKFAHLVEYLILGLFLHRSYYGIRGPLRRKFLFILITGIVFAAIDESHQAFIPGRFASWGDFIADSLGIIVSLPLGAQLRKRE